MKLSVGIGLILLLNLSAVRASDADYSMNRDCLKAYGLILQLKLDEAHNLLADAEESNPANNIIPYLKNYSDFLKIIISEDEALFESLSPLIKERDDQLESGTENSPWHLYCQAQGNLQWAFARIKFGDYTSAALNLNRSYRQLKANKEKFPDFSLNNAALGLLHMLIGSVPENYRWIMSTFSFQGTVEQGVVEIKQLIENPVILARYPFLKSESLFLLTFIPSNFSASADNSNLLQSLIEDPKNIDLIAKSPLLVYAASSYYLHNAMNDKALSLLNNYPKGDAYYPFHFLDYLTGKAKLNKLDDGARIHFLRFVVNFRGKNNIKSAYLHLAWIGLLNNNAEEYNKYTTRVKLMGSEELENDQQALTEANLNKPPDIFLLKARLLFDGGYYTEALAELGNFNKDKSGSPREMLEFTYRLARIYDKSGNTKKAVEYYMQTLEKGADYPYYFAANSALQLGNIYEASGNTDKARYYYKKCLNLNYDEYRSGISQKAKAGLSALK